MSSGSYTKLDVTVPDDYKHMKSLVEQDLAFLIKKDKTYAGSWKQRGGVGAFMMLARKWDRIENFAKGHSKQYDIFDLVLSSKDPEDILDDFKDLRNYLLLAEDFIRKQMETQAAHVESRPLEGSSRCLHVNVEENFNCHTRDTDVKCLDCGKIIA